MTRYVQLKPGALDHIDEVPGPDGGRVLECSICKSQFDPKNPGRRHRMPRLHWTHTHAKCKKTE